MIRYFVLCLLLQLGMGVAQADNSFFDQRYRGWLWFDEKQKEEDQLEVSKNNLPTIEEMEKAKSENEAFSKELELLKHLAIRNPENLDYVRLYKLKEKEMYDKAQTLGMNWIMSNFLNPEIVDELKNPQNIYGRQVLQAEKQKEDKSNLSLLSKKVELFVFRKDSCPYCSDLEIHLRTFANRYGFVVEAISPDGSQSKQFKTHTSPELISALNLEVMPTIVAVVSDTRERFELARGAVSVVDLEEKALLLFKYLNKSASKEEVFTDERSEGSYD